MLSFVFQIKLLLVSWLLMVLPGRVVVVQCQQQYNNNDGDDGGYYYDDGSYGYNNGGTGIDPSSSTFGSGSGDDINNADNLYHDYAERQYSKEVGSGGIVADGWIGSVSKIAAGGVLGWVIGAKYHTKKLSKKLYDQHKKDQKLLYTQYYNDVYTLQKQNSELIDALEQYIMASSGGGTTTGTSSIGGSSTTGTKKGTTNAGAKINSRR